MKRKFVLATLFYAAVTMIHGFTWHFNFFKEAYAELGIYNREPPIIPLGFASMLVQGLIMAGLYPRWYRGGDPLGRGIQFGLVMGAFLFSVSTLANAAKIQVSPMSTWLAIQSAFHLIQFIVAGAGIGLIYGKAHSIA
jgi:hypothetical protein